MALTWSRLLTVLNGGTLFVSLALVGISPAILYLTSHNMRRMDKKYPQGQYEWYRGPSYDMDTKHKVRLMYESSNEYIILAAAAAVSILAGLVGVVGFFLNLRVSKMMSTLLVRACPLTHIVDLQAHDPEVHVLSLCPPRIRNFHHQPHCVRVHSNRLRHQQQGAMLLGEWLQPQQRVQMHARAGGLQHRVILH